MRSKANKIMKFLQMAKAPIKILCKARDAYVKGMLGYSGRGHAPVRVGGAVACLPKSFSVNSSMEMDEEEFRRLLRLMSNSESDIETCVQNNPQQDRKLRSTNCHGVKRSYSVGLGKIGTIDEDRACSFREDVDVNNNFYASKSHVIR